MECLLVTIGLNNIASVSFFQKGHGYTALRSKTLKEGIVNAGTTQRICSVWQMIFLAKL